MDTSLVFSLSSSGSDSKGDGLGGLSGCVSGISRGSFPGILILEQVELGGGGVRSLARGSSKKSEREATGRRPPGLSVSLLGFCTAGATLDCAGTDACTKIGADMGTGMVVGPGTVMDTGVDMGPGVVKGADMAMDVGEVTGTGTTTGAGVTMAVDTPGLLMEMLY